MHSPCAADLVAADDLAHAGDATRFARTDFLPTETRWIGWKTFSYLEVPNNEVECRDTKSRAPFRRIDPRQLSHDETGYLWRPAAGAFWADSARKWPG